MHSEYLVRMANDIGHFFAASDPSQEEAARNVLSHIKKFWDPRMRSQIVEHYRTGGEGLEGFVRTAVGMLAEEAASKGK
jgi:formate dehydrogenase subunit delta